MTYRNQMTGELSHTRQEDYDLWDVVVERARCQFGPTHEGEIAL